MDFILACLLYLNSFLFVKTPLCPVPSIVTCSCYGTQITHVWLSCVKTDCCIFRSCHCVQSVVSMVGIVIDLYTVLLHIIAAKLLQRDECYI